ncbi:MAG: tRNA pseudouridine(55) synthase TruB [Propionibacteriaceae bacterium]|jgi:tRNA pseudouridine55 synthase|nr:tRNA pseudouridine(55) synthase TruB [Propionibacteriaceae bacterium]
MNTPEMMATSNLPTDGCLLVDKPQGLTSQQVVSRVKRALGVRKAGHAGTLDPMATGLLIVGLGRATRLLGYLSGQDKQYAATIRLGQATTTDDAEGEPIGHPQLASHLSTTAIEAAIGVYRGAIEQTPSAVSAIKVQGRRAYDLVRQGETPQLKSRQVMITRYDLVQRADQGDWVDLEVIVDCSTGTYIRALARDLGQDLGVGGHLTRLRRTRAGQFAVEDAVDLEAVSLEAILPLATMARAVAPAVQVREDEARAVGYGRGLDLLLPAEVAAVFYGERFLGLYRQEAETGRAEPLAVFIDPSEEHNE